MHHRRWIVLALAILCALGLGTKVQAQTITSPTTTTGTVGAAFSYQITASFTPTSYSASFPYYIGLDVNSSTGIISGTPMASGTFSAQIGAFDSKYQKYAASGTLTILVVDNLSPVITSSTTATGNVGVPFSFQITATNNPTSFSGTLPSGLTLDGTTGLISGTPVATGTYPSVIQASNQYGTGSATLNLTIRQAPPVISDSNTLTSLSYSYNSLPSYPKGGLCQARDGKLYGVAGPGVGQPYGSVIQLAPGWPLFSSGGILFTFSGTNGNSPQASLVQANDGALYGTTYRGGSADAGTIFRITTSGSLTTLWSFSQTDGSGPSGLIQGTDGNYYGTTYSGGSDGYGTVFRITASGSLATLFSFKNDANGASPCSRLTQGMDGSYFGTTYSGGTGNYGTLFRITATGSLTTLCSFSGTTGPTLGSAPKGDMAQGSDGCLYGTTYTGGTYDKGTVFRLSSSGSLATLCSFTGNSGPMLGANPSGLIRGSDANFYGITESGGPGIYYNYGTAYRITSSGSLTTLIAFNSGTVTNPIGSLAQGLDGSLYGITAAGYGGIFKIVQSLLITGNVGGGTYGTVYFTGSSQSFSAQGMPTGFVLSPWQGNVSISGTSMTTGTFNATISATNSGGTGSGLLTIVIQPQPPLITSTLNTPTPIGAPFTYQIAATNGPTSFDATGLPSGLSVSPFGRLISGTPTQTGTFTVSITANNPMGSDSKPLTISILNPLDYWKSQAFTPAELADESASGDLACPAGDGIPNLMKYALSLNPKANGTGGLPKAAPLVTGSGRYLSLAYTRAISATDLVYTTEVSNDLQTWNSGPAYTAPVQVTNDPGGQTQSVVEQDLVPMDGAAHRFIRLRVTKQTLP